MPSTLARTAMYSRAIPGGVYVIDDAGQFTGDHYWVDSGQTTTGGDTVGHGRHPEEPFLTLNYASTQCTANNGDTITVMPGHAEVVTEAAGLALAVAGVTVLGVGDGSLQPTVTLTTIDSADVDIDAANVTIENIHFVAGVADIVAFIDINADDFTLRRCRFNGDNGGLNALIYVQDAAGTASDRITIENCHCNDLDASNTHFVNFAGTGDGHIVRNNILIGDFGTVCIGGAGEITCCAILDNRIYNVSATAEAAIHVADAATGIVMGNMAGGTAAQAQGIGATACALAENYYGDLGGDVSALLEPVVT